MRNADRLQVLHRRSQRSRLDVLVAFELDLADLDLRPFLDHKRNADRRRRNLPNLGANRGELPPMLGQQALDRNFRLLDARRIVLTLDHQADFVLLEAVEHVAVRNRTEPDIVDFADRRLFFHLDDQAPALGRLLPQELDVLEIARVPQGVEVALQRGRVVNISGLGENARPDGFGGDAAVAADVDLGNDIVLRPGQAGSHQPKRGQRQANPARTPPHSWPRPLK